jgi:hypothetical protein
MMDFLSLFLGCPKYSSEAKRVSFSPRRLHRKIRSLFRRGKAIQTSFFGTKYRNGAILENHLYIKRR